MNEGHDLDAVLAEYDQIIVGLTRQLIAARLEIRRLTETKERSGDQPAD